MWSVCFVDFYDFVEYKLFILDLYYKFVYNENLILMFVVNLE